jgi:DNA-binding NarL/FixJ family response regulator/AraC-like DNA-binding protein
VRPVLIVDDEPLVRVTLRSRTRWERWGFACAAEAGNGEEALAALAAHPDIALVILDLVMPRMDGLEFLRRLRERGPMPQVIVLSAHEEFRMVREAFQLGAADYLLKSELEPERLEPLIAAAAGRLERFGGGPAVAGHATALKQDALRRLLTEAEAPLDPAELAARGVRLGAMLRLGLLTVRDFEEVSARYDASSPSGFPLGLMAVVEQVLSRHGAGEIVRIADDAYVLLVCLPERHAAARLDALCDEVARDAGTALASYLNVRVDIAWSIASEVGVGPSPAAMYAALARGRSTPSRLVEQARRRIRESYADLQLQLRTLSRELGVTPNHLSAQFVRETGRSFREYLSFVRIEAAKRLLASSTLKVWEVAEQVGFLNVEHFSRVFKKLTGVPPHLFTRSPGA